MRALSAVLLLAALASGCTPYIPVKPDFGTSAAVRTKPVPPGFAAFNAYNPRVNALLADQLCATPPQPVETKVLSGSPGKIVQARTRCRTHIPLFGP